MKTGKELLIEWGCRTRTQKLERAVKALMNELDVLHEDHHGESLKKTKNDCSCADAYRMGKEALRK